MSKLFVFCRICACADVIAALRARKVFVRCISFGRPEDVISVLLERSGGYVRRVERRGGMTVVARYSCQYGPQEREFSDFVLRELLAFKREINVERFTLPLDQGGWGWSVDRVQQLYEDVLWNNPQIFYVNKINFIRWRGNKEHGARFTRIDGYTYAIDAADYLRCKAELESAAREAFLGLTEDADPVQKALHLHDYIVRHCEYDLRGKGNPTPDYRTAYDVLVRHRAVCEGYVMAYRYLLSMAGIESEEIISDEMRHCWSYLHLGSHWYHVDVTWDDPFMANKPTALKDVVYHRYFLLSDEAICKKKHHDWDTRGLPVADDTTFDNMTW